MATSTSEVVGKEREEDGEAIIPSSPDHASPTSSSYSRRIAFIIYLVQPDWSLSDGGCLQLFESVSDATLGLYAQPGRIVKSLVPRFNSMAFFEVTPTSYHQVQEVLRRDDRVSIR